MYVIVHRIFEGTDAMPTVEHRFFGRNLEEAQAVYDAHRQTDRFLCACDDRGRFGKIRCRVEIYGEAFT